MSKKVYNLLFENEAVPDTPEEPMHVQSSEVKTRKALDSVDDQIDALILRYESSAIRDDEPNLMESSLSRKNLKYLLEQEEDPAAEADTADPPPEAEAAEETPAEPTEPTGSEKMSVDEPGKEKIPDLDIDAFAMRSVRLIMNYKNLLRIEEAIINRIKNFLDDNYGEAFVQSYLDILEKQYGISVTEFDAEYDVSDDDFGVGAFAGGTGGLGGGGG